MDAICSALISRKKVINKTSRILPVSKATTITFDYLFKFIKSAFRRIGKRPFLGYSISHNYRCKSFIFQHK